MNKYFAVEYYTLPKIGERIRFVKRKGVYIYDMIGYEEFITESGQKDIFLVWKAVCVKCGKAISVKSLLVGRLGKYCAKHKEAAINLYMKRLRARKKAKAIREGRYKGGVKPRMPIKEGYRYDGKYKRYMRVLVKPTIEGLL